MNKPIRMAFPTPVDLRKFDTGAFTVTPTSRLQRLAWKFLRWRGVVNHYFSEDLLVHEVVIDPDKVVTLIVGEAADQLRQVGYKPTTVYMGPKEFIRAGHQDYQFLRSVPPFGFKAEATRILPDSKYELLSFEVKVVPYMRGILVI